MRSATNERLARLGNKKKAPTEAGAWNREHDMVTDHDGPGQELADDFREPDEAQKLLGAVMAALEAAKVAAISVKHMMLAALFFFFTSLIWFALFMIERHR
jgi:hypothetical protein